MKDINMILVKNLTKQLADEMGLQPTQFIVMHPMREREWFRWTFEIKKLYSDARRKGYTLCFEYAEGRWWWMVQENDYFAWYGYADNGQIVVNYRTNRIEMEKRLIERRKR